MPLIYSLTYATITTTKGKLNTVFTKRITECIREVILYDDEIVITYNFADSPEHLKLTKEYVIKTEKEIETADKTAVSSNTGSYKLCHTAPEK